MSEAHTCPGRLRAPAPAACDCILAPAAFNAILLTAACAPNSTPQGRRQRRAGPPALSEGAEGHQAGGWRRVAARTVIGSSGRQRRRRVRICSRQSRARGRRRRRAAAPPAAAHQLPVMSTAQPRHICTHLEIARQQAWTFSTQLAPGAARQRSASEGRGCYRTRTAVSKQGRETRALLQLGEGTCSV